jgi:UTP--glucose-1-phosphate uridylyltransferase
MSDRRAITKAVIPAAGFGTRMLPATKALPKEMLPVAGKPLIQHAVEEAVASGIETVILVVRTRESLIQDHFARAPELESFLEARHLMDAANDVRGLSRIADLQFVQQETPLGLAHAIACAQPLIGNEAFVVLLPDVILTSPVPAILQLILAHREHGGSIVAIHEVEQQDVERHGIVRVERSPSDVSSKFVRITGLVEKPVAAFAPSPFGVLGRYLLESAIWDAIALTDPDARGEVQLTDALNLLCQTNVLSGLCLEGCHYDAGDRLGYLKANLELSLRDPQLRPSLLHYLSRLQA